MTDTTAPAQAGPTVHRFTDTDTAYDIIQSEERHHMGIRDGDLLVVESEGVVGVLANNWPIALTAAHGQFHLAAERYNIREMNDGRYAASGDAAERVAAELGLSLLPHHRAPVAAPAAEAPEDVEDVWEAGHCTTMRGGVVHEVTTGLDGSDGGPVHIFPLCRTGAMTNQGTQYRKVTGELTCRNCIANRERRRAAKARRLAEAAAVEAPAVDEVAPAEEAPAFVKGERVVCADGMTRTVDHMKRYVADEPEYVVMECGALWIATNCTRADQDQAAPAAETPAAVETPPVSEARRWRIEHEAERLLANRDVTERARAILRHAGHPEAAEGRAGFLFRTNWLAVSLYAHDALGAELTGYPLDDAFDAYTATLEAHGWLVEYSKVGYHGSSLTLTAPLTDDTPAPADGNERTALLTEIGARLAAGLVWITAAAFEPVRDGEEVIGWTYRTRSGSEVRYGYVAARGLVLEGFHELRCREAAARELLAHRAAGTDIVDPTLPVATYLEAVAARSTQDLIAALHAFNVDVVKTTPESSGRLIVQRGQDFMGTIFDAGSNSRRGRYEAWSPYAGTRHNLVGFHATAEAATDAIAHAWPVAAWELTEETGASVPDVLAAANLLAQEEGVKVHLQIANATGADQKFYRDAAAILSERLTAARQADEPAADEPADELDKRRARQLVAGTWPNAEKFQERRAENGRLIGYTFQVGALHVARYGWITAGGTFAKALEPYRSHAVALLPMADRDERAARR